MQVVPGIIIAPSGPNGQQVAVLFGTGDPNSAVAPTQIPTNTSSVGGVVTYVTPLETNVLNAFTADQGSLYLRFDGSTSTTLYVKTTYAGNVWTAK